MSIDHPSGPVQGRGKALEENVSQAKGGWAGAERKESISSLCLGNTCSLRLREDGALFTSVYTNDSELGPILGKEQTALRVQGKSRHTKSLTTHEGVGEASCILDLIKRLGELSNVFGSANPKTHVTKELIYLPLF